MDLKALEAALKPEKIVKTVTSAASAAKAALTHHGTQHSSSKEGSSSSEETAKMAATAKVVSAIQGHWLSASLAVMLQLKIADILMAHQAPTTAASPAAAAAGAETGATAEGQAAAAAAPCPGTERAAAAAEAPAGSGGAAAAAAAAALIPRHAVTMMNINEIAEACGATTPTATSHLYKVLRVLAQYELLDELPGRNFTPNTATAQLVQGEVPSLGHLASHLVNPPKWDAWKVLPQAVQQGKTAFVLAHGMDVYQFGEQPEQAAFADEFMKAMSYFTRHSLTGGHTSLKDAYDWPNCRVILDVGGGRGELLSSVMSWARGDCRGLLLDRQMVIDSIDIPGMFGAKGVTGAAGRLSLLVGDVRETFPQPVRDAKVDTLLMKHFLSAFSDEDALTIVTHCREVLAPGGSILLLQSLVPEAGDREHNTCEDGVAPGLFAIEILAQCPGGAWRTLSEWCDIFSRAGLQLRANTAVGCNMNLMVWRDAASRW